MGQKNHLFVSTNREKKEYSIEQDKYLLQILQVLTFLLLAFKLCVESSRILCSCLNSKSFNYLKLRERSSQIDMTYQIISAPLFRPQHGTTNVRS